LIIIRDLVQVNLRIAENVSYVKNSSCIEHKFDTHTHTHTRARARACRWGISFWLTRRLPYFAPSVKLILYMQEQCIRISTLIERSAP